MKLPSPSYPSCTGGLRRLACSRSMHASRANRTRTRINPLSSLAFEKKWKSKQSFSFLTSQSHRSSSSSSTPPSLDPICELSSSSVRFGQGCTSEIGMDLQTLPARNILLVTDKHIATLPCMDKVMTSLRNANMHVAVYEDVMVEPTNESFQHGIDFVHTHAAPYDAIVALGGGSTIDTAKAINLYTTHPPENSDFYTYVNAPLGLGHPPPPGPLPPLFAIPTTAGTGSETTGMAIFDDLPSASKTGIGHRRLRPTLGLVDVDNTATLPPPVALYSGLDVLCHAMESYTAKPYHLRQKPKSPLHRPAYQGCNPFSDVWSLHALRLCVKYLPRAVNRGAEDVEAREQMLLASSFAGVGFGNAGVHVCHGMSYPVASQVKHIKPQSMNNDNTHGKRIEPSWLEGYEQAHTPLIPHGLSVSVHAPTAFRYTAYGCPDRHWTCAEILKTNRLEQDGNARFVYPFSVQPKPTHLQQPQQPQPQEVTAKEAGEFLCEEIALFMEAFNVPTNLRALGYTKEDVDRLVEGSLPQQRLWNIAPIEIERGVLREMFLAALEGP